MDIETNTELETKAGIQPDAVVTHAEMMRAFEEFKDTNDKRLAGIDRRRIDVLLNEKVARIDQTIDAQARRLDEIALKNSRPIISGERLRGSPESGADSHFPDSSDCWSADYQYQHIQEAIHDNWAGGRLGRRD